MVADPSDEREFPDMVIANPWPCNKCAPEQLQAELSAEAAEYDQDQWREYWNTVC
jgi:hypothetical protein